MDEIAKKEESTGETRHFLYYIFCWDKEQNPMPLSKATQLLQLLKNAVKKERD